MIPNGWKQKPLHEVAQIQTGIAKGKKDLKDPVELPYLRVANVQDGHLDLEEIKSIAVSRREIGRYSLRENDVLLTEGGDFDKLGRGTIWSAQIEPCLHQNHVFAVRTNPEILDPYFFSLQAGGDHGRSYFLSCAKRSTNLASINSSQLKKFPTILPPIMEQRRISKAIQCWDKAISTAASLISAKQQRKQAMMQQLLTGKMRLPGFSGLRGDTSSNFGRIPNDWRLLKIADFAEQISERNTADDALPVLSCTKHHGLVDSLSYFGKRVFSADTSGYKVVPRNTFAYATNHIEEGSIGYQNLYDSALISPIYTVFRCEPKMIHDAYLLRVLKTETARHIFESMTSSSVDRRGSLRWDDFSTITLPIPSIAEQKRLDQFFSTVDRELTLLEAKKAALETQKKALMAVLLTGKKRLKV